MDEGPSVHFFHSLYGTQVVFKINESIVVTKQNFSNFTELFEFSAEIILPRFSLQSGNVNLSKGLGVSITVIEDWRWAPSTIPRSSRSRSAIVSAVAPITLSTFLVITLILVARAVACTALKSVSITLMVVAILMAGGSVRPIILWILIPIHLIRMLLDLKCVHISTKNYIIYVYDMYFP